MNRQLNVLYSLQFYRLTFISVFGILEVFVLIKLQQVLLKFQLNVDHTATYDIVLLMVFQLVRIISANNAFTMSTFQRFCVLYKRVLTFLFSFV